MPESLSLDVWRSTQADRLNEIESAHQSVGGTARGRRFATQQINRAYAVLLAAQFQGFCRNLHSESAGAILASIQDVNVARVAQANFVFGRTMDRGNAGPGNIGADFARLGLKIWDALAVRDVRNNIRNRKLEELNTWRNAIAHENFQDAVKFPAGRRTVLHLAKVRDWRQTCDVLASHMDKAMQAHITTLTGNVPW
ncbi:MAG: hypothetical protein ACT4O6_04885 [Reyranella sp.]